jgi:hypothetical protein
MSLFSAIQAGLCLSAAVAIVGCGTSNSTTPNPFQGNGANSYASDGGFDATSSDNNGNNGNYNSSSGGSSNTGASSSGGAGNSGGGTCTTIVCTSDTDCMNMCPAAGSGMSNCCEVASGMCYVYGQTACPTAPVGAAE